MQKPLNISSRFSTLPILPVIADSVTRRFEGGYHCHNHMEIWYVLRGKMKHTINGEEYIQTPGTFACVPAYTTHCIDTSESEDTPVIFSASCDEKEMQRRGYSCFLRHRSIMTFENRELPIFCRLTENQRNAADELARALLDEDFRKYPESPDVRCRLIARLLRCISDDKPKAKISQAFFERTNAINTAADFIAVHYCEKIYLDELAEYAIMSKRRFTENFKAVTGMTVGEMILLYRLPRAGQLLIFSDKTIDEIAKELGFYDKSSFSHAFSDYYGISPSTHRKNDKERSYEFERNEKLKRARRYETLNYYYSLANNGKELPKTYVTNMPGLI